MNKKANSTLYFYQGDKVITVKQGEQSRSIFRGSEMPLAEQKNDSADGFKFLMSDNKGSVLKANINNQNDFFVYTAHGHIETENKVSSLLGFNGERREDVTGCYLLGNGYRAYSPTLMCFISPDSLSPFGAGGINAYSYCAGDPINRSDPSGHTLVHLPNGQSMRVSKNMATPLRTRFSPSKLQRTTSHASGLSPNAPAYSEPKTQTNHFDKINEPDTYQSIVNNLSAKDVASFSRASTKIYDMTSPILKKYKELLSVPGARRSAAHGKHPNVPRKFVEDMDTTPEFHSEINRIEQLRGADKFLALQRFNRQQDRLNRMVRNYSTDSLDSLILDSAEVRN